MCEHLTSFTLVKYTGSRSQKMGKYTGSPPPTEKNLLVITNRIVVITELVVSRTQCMKI